jgi:hypothetical protein
MSNTHIGAALCYVNKYKILINIPHFLHSFKLHISLPRYKII